MQEKAVAHLLSVKDKCTYISAVGVPTDYSLIPNLPTRFGIKRRLIHDHYTAFTDVKPIDFVVTMEESYNFRLNLLSLVTEELCRPKSFFHTEPKAFSS